MLVWSFEGEFVRVNPTIFRTLSIILFIVFLLFVSDVRNKKTKPIIRQPWLTMMRIAYPIAPFCYLYFLFKVMETSLCDYAALLLMIIGTIIVIIAKLELGKNHSWAGYFANETSEFVTTGIYSFVRHPLYLGIVIAVTGTIFVVLPRLYLNMVLFLFYLVGMICSFVFMFISSLKETEFLLNKFGEPFKQYIDQVPAYFPNLFRRK